MEQIKLELKVEEANMILEALGNLPFVKVHDLISNIHKQASQQATDHDATAMNDKNAALSPQVTEE